DQLARLIHQLDKRTNGENTIVIITGDHGESMGEHADLNEDGRFFHPHSLYDTEQRVPLLLRYPEQVHAGTVIDVPTQAIDLFPTVLQMAGTPVPDQSQGSSLIGLLDGTDSGANRAAYASMPDYTFTSVTDGTWKLIQNNASGLRRLYDLRGDPGEQHDQLESQPDVAKELSAKLDGWMKETKIA
ncbi:MAG: sulfatase-like hydrolase/transferase, partial [Chloroflexota bacterium]|nr:sulfatase-like hydrolase/transferase [Chloroflexota bacterium]